MNKKNKKHRGLPLVIFLITFALLFGWFIWQQEALQPETYTVSGSKLPTVFDSFRIAHLSDLHGKEFGTDHIRLLQEVEQLQPDIIVITGDLIDRVEQLDNIPTLAAGLSAIAPTYYVTGNHEWAVGKVNDIKSLLSEHGVTVLSNEYITLEREGETIVLAGLDDPNGPPTQKRGDQLYAEITEEVGEDVYTILLSHRNSLDYYTSWGFDLTLCGHGHGGVIRIPILDKGLVSSNRTLFPKYDAGLYQLEGGTYLVSRGLGSNTTPLPLFRLFNRPHLPLIVLQA